jgi:hypothetical protein
MPANIATSHGGILDTLHEAYPKAGRLTVAQRAWYP